MASERRLTHEAIATANRPTVLFVGVRNGNVVEGGRPMDRATFAAELE
ncbi:hypothetical protein ACFWPK_09130 [Nocardia sp. NPDC058519]